MLANALIDRDMWNPFPILFILVFVIVVFLG